MLGFRLSVVASRGCEFLCRESVSRELLSVCGMQTPHTRALYLPYCASVLV